ncbi:MAG: Clp amino terminal domain, pathogenicity island component [Solirubrobacteraceae bacterium]|jgi:hypothetical protein|nr:Clp amino terminal domain, pathogenicity island component [Solirubrobacteraceae bacterium]
MASVWGRCPALPKRILDGVFARAFALGRPIADDDLFLLAIAELDEAQPARRALAAEGIDAQRLLSSIRVGGDGPLAQSLTFAPAYYKLEGRAQAFAATLGDGRITPEHVLLALLWDPGNRSSQLVWRLGAGRERIVERLRELGIPAPAAPLPPQRQIEWGPRVWFDRADVRRVTDHLRAHIPPGTRWGTNWEGDRVWVIAESTVDLDALVRGALET